MNTSRSRSVMQETGSIVPGSLSSMATLNNQTLAETFLNADVVVIVDVSGSMGSQDAGDGMTRFEKACSELALLQQRNQGKVAVIGFSNDPMFYPGGKPSFMGAGTRMDDALAYAKVADVDGMAFFLISDGEPSSRVDALNVASQYKNKINTIYVGPEGGEGQKFLARLAEASGGVFATAEKVKELASTVETMLLGE